MHNTQARQGEEKPFFFSSINCCGRKNRPLFKMSAQAEVVLVGCGCPLRGMGWYHAVQMLGGECPSAKLNHIVEPWFLGAGRYHLLFIVFGTIVNESNCNWFFSTSYNLPFYEK